MVTASMAIPMPLMNRTRWIQRTIIISNISAPKPLRLKKFLKRIWSSPISMPTALKNPWTRRVISSFKKNTSTIMGLGAVMALKSTLMFTEVGTMGFLVMDGI